MAKKKAFYVIYDGNTDRFLGSFRRCAATGYSLQAKTLAELDWVEQNKIFKENYTFTMASFNLGMPVKMFVGVAWHHPNIDSAIRVKKIVQALFDKEQQTCDLHVYKMHMWPTFMYKVEDV